MPHVYLNTKKFIMEGEKNEFTNKIINQEDLLETTNVLNHARS